MNDYNNINEIYEKELIKSVIYYGCENLKISVPNLKYHNCDFIEIDIAKNEFIINLKKFECLNVEEGIYWLFFYLRNMYQRLVINGFVKDEFVEKWICEKDQLDVNIENLNYDLLVVVDAIAYARYLYNKFDFSVSPDIRIPDSKKILVESLVSKFCEND